MFNYFRQIGRLFYQTWIEWNEDNVPRLGAALAFYSALSIAPLLVISLRVAAYFFGDDAARGEIEHQMDSMIGDQGAEAIQAMLQNANHPENGTFATVFSVVMLLFGASGVFGELQSSLNTIWEVKPKSGRGIWDYVRDRFLSVAMVMGVAFLFVVSLVVSAMLSFISTYVLTFSGEMVMLSNLVNVVVSLAVFTGIFAALFKVLPDVIIGWRDVWYGALMTAILFTLGKAGIGLYLGQSSMASSYGVAGSLVVLLVWVYYSAQIVFFGAEFTQVYANRYGKKIVPTDNAVAAPTKQHGQMSPA
ncbi:MAG TPA: YihY/virulence factor BrkB family protein [Planctomycetaceae bacterium]|nr:YihY/virulence factor BrkB family protein [Planctomycetaceae bacterium]